ncbi:peptide-methionine (R)-S-oxide reductase MsrB [Balneatrix alpica]|uniref:Peptide methionine sulfoxide reductase MsrB n=1 Tax=Balneatrix alpica TaxID=75684 RepID=A0ABV5ZFF3_9GAMM|nr:peptide-methionine (R)-S-oxide reductase MsrB [Balneatrix alpica]
MTTSASGFDLTPLSDEERQARAASLSAEERHVILNQGTERPFCGQFYDHQQSGTYHCRLCTLPLFQAAAKFDSGSGWPSFFQPIDPDHIRYLEDRSHGMLRTEIRCRRCDGHLGHVFADGPPPSGQRYCLNSLSLSFIPDETTW